MNAREALRLALSECRTELTAIEKELAIAWGRTYDVPPSQKVDWGHVGDANRLLADLKDIRRYWVTNTVAK